MRARRSIGAGAAALLVAGTLSLPAGGAAAAVPSDSTTRSISVSHYRLVRSAQLRRVATSVDGPTARAITKAVRTSEFTAGVPTSAYAVSHIRVHRSWARATLRPVEPAQIDPAIVLLTASKGRWTVVDLGTAEVGCGIAPASALTALGLDCP